MAVTNPGLQKFLYGAVGLPAGLVMVSLTMPRLLKCVRTHMHALLRLPPAAGPPELSLVGCHGTCAMLACERQCLVFLIVMVDAG